MSKEFKVARYRPTPYTVNYVMNGFTKPYNWSGSKNGKVDIKSVPEEIIDYLNMNSITFRDGELVIINDNEDAVEKIDNIDDQDSYKANTHTLDQIQDFLSGNIKKMKEECEKITVDSEKAFVIETAKTMKDKMTMPKMEFLAKWADMPMDILFPTEE